jgi:hypothetical protein
MWIRNRRLMMFGAHVVLVKVQAVQAIRKLFNIHIGDDSVKPKIGLERVFAVDER